MADWLKIICAGTKVESLSKYLWTFMKKVCNICLCQPWWSELDLNWTGIPTFNICSFFFLFFFLLHSIFQPFNYCGWHLIHLCSLKDISWRKGILQNEYEPAFSIFWLHALKCRNRFAVPFTASSPSLSPISTYFIFFFFLPHSLLCVRWSGAPVQGWRPGES